MRRADSGCSEASNNRISLDEDDPQTVACFIHYLYHFDYINFKQTGISPIVMDVRMYVVADKYLVEPLKNLAAKKFGDGARGRWNTRAFADAIRKVYESAAKDSPLKHTIIEVVELHRKDLLDPKRGFDAFHEVLGNVPEFGRDVSVALRSLCSYHDWFRCSNCGMEFMMYLLATAWRCPFCDRRSNATQSRLDWLPHMAKDPFN